MYFRIFVFVAMMIPALQAETKLKESSRQYLANTREKNGPYTQHADEDKIKKDQKQQNVDSQNIQTAKGDMVMNDQRRQNVEGMMTIFESRQENVNGETNDLRLQNVDGSLRQDNELTKPFPVKTIYKRLWTVLGSRSRCGYLYRRYTDIGLLHFGIRCYNACLGFNSVFVDLCWHLVIWWANMDRPLDSLIMLLLMSYSVLLPDREIWLSPLIKAPIPIFFKDNTKTLPKNSIGRRSVGVTTAR